MNTHIEVQEHAEDRFDHEVDDEANDSEIWPPEVEEAFQEAYEMYPSTGRTKLKADDGRLYGRNELISRHIFEATGKVRTRKQVSSHIQVLIKKHNRFAPEYLRSSRPGSLRTASAIHMNELMNTGPSSSRAVSSDSVSFFKAIKKKASLDMRDAYPSPASSRKASSSSTAGPVMRETRSKSKSPKYSKPIKKFDCNDDVTGSDSENDLIEPPVDRMAILLEAATYIADYDRYLATKRSRSLDIDLKLSWRFLNFDSQPSVSCVIEAPLNQILNVFVEIYCGSDLVSAEKVPTIISQQDNDLIATCDMKVVESAVHFVAKTVETMNDALARRAHLDQYRIRVFVARHDFQTNDGGDQYYGLKFAVMSDGKEALDFYKVHVDQA